MWIITSRDIDDISLVHQSHVLISALVTSVMSVYPLECSVRYFFMDDEMLQDIRLLSPLDTWMHQLLPCQLNHGSDPFSSSDSHFKADNKA